jgi:hypothetical protein
MEVRDVTSSDINVILLKLEHLEGMMTSIHEEVKRTNGRVTELEMSSAKWNGIVEGKRMQTIIATSVISGGILAAIIWFVTNAI